MRKELKDFKVIVCTAIILGLFVPLTSFAVPVTLDEALNETTPINNAYTNTEQPPAGIPALTPVPAAEPAQQTINLPKNDNKLIKDLQSASDMSQYDDGTVKKYAAPIQRILGKLVLILSYITVAIQIFFFSFDLLYLVAPPLRKFLANGHIGNPQAGNQMGMGGVGGGMGDMGMSGMNGMGGLYGGRFSHYGGGYGGNVGGMGMNNPYAGNPGMTDLGSRRSNIQWVSNAAISAASSETAMTADGSVNNKFKIYFSQMITDGVVLAILLTLNVTGITQAIGFYLGGLLTGGAQSFLK